MEIWDTGVINNGDSHLVLDTIQKYSGPPTLSAGAYDAIYIETGTWNCLAYYGHVPDTPSQYEASIRKIIAATRVLNPTAPIIFATTMPTLMCLLGAPEEYNAVLFALAAEHPNVYIDDLYGYVLAQGLERIDGVHYSMADYALIARHVNETIQGLLYPGDPDWKPGH